MRAALGPGQFAAGKTGTTENSGDAWFVGFTKRWTVAVWVGYPDKLKPMLTEFAGAPVEGGTYPALIWHDFMVAANAIADDRNAKDRAKGACRPSRRPTRRRPPPRRRSSPRKPAPVPEGGAGVPAAPQAPTAPPTPAARGRAPGPAAAAAAQAGAPAPGRAPGTGTTTQPPAQTTTQPPAGAGTGGAGTGGGTSAPP